jgi:hypothetical protein
VTRNYVAVAIDQDRHIEAEGLDAFGNLPDLLSGVTPWVGGVRFELLNPAISDRHPRWNGCGEI